MWIYNIHMSTLLVWIFVMDQSESPFDIFYFSDHMSLDKSMVHVTLSKLLKCDFYNTIRENIKIENE